MHGRLVNDYGDHAQLAESDSELELNDEDCEYEERSIDDVSEYKRRAECEEESAIDTRAIRKEMMNDEKRRWTQHTWDCENDMMSVQFFLAVAEPTCTLLRKVGSGHAFVGKISHRMYHAQEKINKAKDGGFISNDFAGQVLHVLHKRWDYLHRPITSVDYMLDPEFIEVNPYAMESVQQDLDVVVSSVLQPNTERSTEQRKERTVKQYQMTYRNMNHYEFAE